MKPQDGRFLGVSRLGRALLMLQMGPNRSKSIQISCFTCHGSRGTQEQCIAELLQRNEQLERWPEASQPEEVEERVTKVLSDEAQGEQGEAEAFEKWTSRLDSRASKAISGRSFRPLI